MSDLFEEDKEVVTYRTVDEAIEKAKYLIDHEDVREEIGKAGQERTLKDHTVFSRCQLIDEAIQKML
jgi:spore maturation protein CgeB